MKKVKRFYIKMLIALTVLLAVSVIGFVGGQTANADTYYYSDPYSYYFEDYDVTYDVSANRAIAVTEKLTVHYTGRESTGIIKDIPINGGEQVKNIIVYELVNGVQTSVPYDVYTEDSDFISVDIGDYSNKTDKVCTYLLTYDYCLTKAQEGKDALFLNVIGLGRSCEIKNVSVTLILPSGYKSAEYLIGDELTETRYNDCPERKDGENTILELKNISLSAYEGITFEMQFESGVLSTYFDATPFLFLIPAFVLLAVLVLLKLFVFNKNYLTPVVNYEAPNKMDPLIMGKLIDNKVDSEDVTSLIFYWASKGYIKINLDDKNNPTIIRVMNALPENSPAYEKLMYNNLFKSGDAVKPSQLTNKFYRTVEQVSAMVNKQVKGLYENNSIIASTVFAILGGLILGLAPIILAMLNVSLKLLMLPALIIIIPLVVINFLAQSFMCFRLKYSKGKLIGYGMLIAILCLVIGIFYTIFVPSSIISVPAKIVLFIVCCPLYTISAILITRTKDYTEKLNDIIGFKNFITLAEKDQLEMMLEEDPQFYYNILPYAQVLGVTSKWEEKFASITVQPPKWLTGNVVTTYVEFRVVNSILKSSMGKISSGMVSRPSSSGASGGGGGFHGGHVGGGHGGGGFRGR